MKSFLITLHRWLGLPVGLLFIVTFGTGFIYAVDELLHRQAQAQFDQSYSYRLTTVAEDAAALEVLSQNLKGINRIQLPTQAAPYYQASSRQGSWTYAIDDLNHATYLERQESVFFNTVLQLHRNFLLGKEGFLGVEGKHIAAWVGLLALLLSLLGLWMWWPLRKSFKLKSVLPQGVKRKHFYLSHMTSGVIVLVAIVLFSLTGASITYRTVAQQILSVSEQDAPVEFIVKRVDANWQAWLMAAYEEMPEQARLLEIRYPREAKPSAQPLGDEVSQQAEQAARVKGGEGYGGQRKVKEEKVLTFRFATEADWLGLALSDVKIDVVNSSIVDARQFGDFSLNEKIYLLLKPLHMGKGLPLIYVLAQLLFSFFGTVMVFSGLVSFIVKKRKKRTLRSSDSVEFEISQA